MVVDDLFGVIHTAVTDLDGVAVKYLAEAMILREMLEATYRRRQNHELLQARTIRIQRPSRTEHHQVLQKSTT